MSWDIVFIVGNRPEIIKLSLLMERLQGDNITFVYTGQHFSYEMKDQFLDWFGVRFDHDLRCQTSDIVQLRNSIVDLLTSKRPKYVVVYGDTNSTVAGALAAKHTGCKLIHLEAGLRSFDHQMIEERNRVLVDSLSDYLLAPTLLNHTFLRYEGRQDGVYVSGNMIVDVCKKYSQIIDQTQLHLSKPLPNEYILLTVHRAETVDNPVVLSIILSELSKLNYEIIFPIHPRTHSSILRYSLPVPRNVRLIPPQGYPEFLTLIKKSILVMTDSGGVQEEAVIMRKPCVTLRDSTERQETLLVKANRLCPVWKRENSLVDTVREMVGIKIVTHPYGQNVTEKTVEIIDEIIGNRYDTSLRNVHRPENELRPRRSLQAGLALTS